MSDERITDAMVEKACDALYPDWRLWSPSNRAGPRNRARTHLEAVLPDILDEVERLREKAAWWESTCEYWNEQTQARDRIIELQKLDQVELATLRARLASVREIPYHEDEAGHLVIFHDALFEELGTTT